MIDQRLLQTDPDFVQAALLRRGQQKAQILRLMDLANQRRAAIGHTETLRQSLNEASAQMGKQLAAAAHAGADAAPPPADADFRDRVRQLKLALKSSEEQLQAAEAALNVHLLEVPNLPDPSVPDGSSEADNRIEGSWGHPKELGFAPKPHWDLAEHLRIISFAQASKVSGARFAYAHGAGARLERALATFMLDLARQHGYAEVSPPLLVHPDSMVATGQYPKFIGEAFEARLDPLVLIPTSEVPLVAMHRDSILESADLPLRYCAYTPCFRREAGAAGRDTRGLIRLHQFSKVELVSFTAPQASAAEHERLTGHAEAVLQQLNLPYRKVTLCTADLGFAAKKTYDLEVWLPSVGGYREISSCSNCGDFQARRAAIRYRPERLVGSKKPSKPALLHTLNGSALAVGRALVAVLENYQQADGSIEVPKALQPYFGAERIEAA
jgi:seryl-tRNA synthetase